MRAFLRNIKWSFRCWSILSANNDNADLWWDGDVLVLSHHRKCFIAASCFEGLFIFRYTNMSRWGLVCKLCSIRGSFWQPPLCIYSINYYKYKTLIILPPSLCSHLSSVFLQTTYTVGWTSMWRHWRSWRSCVSWRGKVSSQQGFLGRAKLREKPSPSWMRIVRIHRTKFHLIFSLNCQTRCSCLRVIINGCQS